MIASPERVIVLYSPTGAPASQPSPKENHPSIRAAVLGFACAACAAWLALALPAVRADAQSGPETVRADAADRRWTPVTGPDAALTGSGLATDPASSVYANPALALLGPEGFRLSGFVMNPNRDDLRTETVDYDDANGFFGVGEAAARFRAKGLGVSLYYSQPQYEHGESRFIGFNPETGSGGDPFPRTNEFTSATRYGGAGAAIRLASGVLVGAALEAVFMTEKYSSVPQSSGLPAETIDTDRNFTSFGGSLGVAVPFDGPFLAAGSIHLAANATDGDASDEPPMLGLVGLRYGRTAGSQAYAGYRYLGARDLDLAEPGGAPMHVNARNEFSGGYAFLDPAGTWSFRLGGSYSPRPEGADVRLTRFGIGVGLGGEGLRGTIAYTRDSESRSDGRNSSRNLVFLVVELER